jgi:hypothetical protein
MALVASLELAVNVLAISCSSRLPVMVTGSDQAVEAALGEASEVRMVLAAPQVARLSWRYCLVLRSWTSSWTRRTCCPVPAVAWPWITNWTPDWTTRPSIGLTMVVSIAEGAGLELKS